MSDALAVVALTLVGVAGTAVAWTFDPARQAVLSSVFGVLLAVLFTVLQAPDVALSQIGVGAALVPLMVVLTVRRIRRGPR
ncbi:Na(+)/H(+) antiporter subunit B [Microtetraspora niveoalba]|uniref:Na(+)/H(+) antiporter subunit B n=1 Tax=Microtetraspora niveoalba TaxID=46175 RepID=UPI0008305044|nr:hydrogenase subunit MbhD domain-containing protein [Microtetraspora niveoalba]